MTNEQLIYRTSADTKAEARDEALRLLRQVSDLPEGIDEDELDELTVTTPAGLCFPAVYARHIKQGDKEKYIIYFVPEEERLPFLYRRKPNLSKCIVVLRPPLRPMEQIGPVAVLNGERYSSMLAALKGMTEASPSQDIARRIMEEPRELRIFSLFEGSPADVKEELENIVSTDSIKVYDMELVLNAATGKTYTSEEDYLNGLAEMGTKEDVDIYRDLLLGVYRTYKALRFEWFLLYELLRTEDYALVESNYADNAAAIGYKEEYARNLIKDEDGSVLEAALASYLSQYFIYASIFEGYTDKRVADYLHMPEETLRKARLAAAKAEFKI